MVGTSNLGSGNGLNPTEKYESVEMMTFPTEWKVIKFMFQTTNQLYMIPPGIHISYVIPCTSLILSI